MSRIIFRVLFLSRLFIGIASAQTIIPGGYVSGTWDLAGSPYLIMDHITVPGESIDPNPLTIEPGVEVLFCGS